MGIRAEEAGAWFPTSYPGSRGALGTLKPTELGVKRVDSGRSLAEHMREEGFDPGFIEAGKKVLSPENTAAYLEVHIEQGPVLEAEGIPVGIVTGIPGSRRLRAGRVLGEYEKITAYEALHAATIGGAFQLHMDHEIGSIEAGKLADFAVLDESPLDVDPMAIRDIAVWGTVVGGAVFEAPKP